MTMLTTRCVALAVGCVSFITSALAAAPKSPQATGPAASGYLEAHQREYTPQICSHNGNTAICTFQLVNRGNALTLHAWPGYVRTLQLVDSSHVPHSAGRAYFIDSSGSHQPQLLQGGDQGTIAVEFPNADSNSTAGEFHLSSQIVAGGSSPGSAGAAAAPAAAATAAPTAASSPASQATTATTAAKTAANTTPAPNTTASAAIVPATVSAACAANPKSGACRAEQQEQRVYAKNASSAACRNAAAHAQKMRHKPSRQLPRLLPA